MFLHVHITYSNAIKLFTKQRPEVYILDVNGVGQYHTYCPDPSRNNAQSGRHACFERVDDKAVAVYSNHEKSKHGRVDGEKLNHGHKEAQKATKYPVLDEHICERYRQNEHAFDQVRERKIAYEKERLIVIQASFTHNDHHSYVADEANKADGGVKEHE